MRFNFLKGRAKIIPKDDEDRKVSVEPVYFISAPMPWSAHVESYLEELDIPYLKRGRKGAALAIELGPSSEIYDYFIPGQTVKKASAGLDELKELLDFPQP